MVELRKYNKKDFANAMEELDVKAGEYSKEKDITYSQAVVHFLTTDKDLARRYEKDRDKPVTKEYRDPHIPDPKDSVFRREYKTYRRVEQDLDTQAKLLMLKYNLGYSDAFRTVLTLPENREKAKEYIGL